MKKFYFCLIFVLSVTIVNAQGDAFITTWEVDGGDLNINFETEGTGYDYTINYGDGTSEDITDAQTVEHIYASAGTYTVSISGDFPRFILDHYSTTSEKLKTVEQWGDIQWQSMERAFQYAYSLTINATDAPDLNQVTNMDFMFRNASLMNNDINNWDVSNVTSMIGTFKGAEEFNQPLNNWDVSNITNMTSMFKDAKAFDQPLNAWDVSNVEDLNKIFSGASNFNQPLSDWDVSNVTDFTDFFKDAIKFNQTLNAWDVSNAATMTRMFRSAKRFNQPLDNWDVSNVTYMNGMFSGANSFNQDLSDWDFNSDVYLSSFITGCRVYSIENYDLLLQRFLSLSIEDQSLNGNGLAYCDETTHQALENDLNWNFLLDKKIQNCGPLPTDAFVVRWNVNDNQTITIPTEGDGYDYTIDFGDGTIDENVDGDATHTYSNEGLYRIIITGDFPRIVFDNGYCGNGFFGVDQWGDVNWESMAGAFRGCTQMRIYATDNPDLSQVTDMSRMFYQCSVFNQSINDWDVSNVENMEEMFAAIYGQSNAYNRSLNNWDVSSVTTMKKMFLRTEFNQDINDWEVSNVTNMKQMFEDSHFNQNISDWDMSNVTDMSFMFYNAESFNKPLNSWNVSSVNNMSYCFSKADSFNQPLDNWNVSNTTDMAAMFDQAYSFNQDLSPWNFNQNVIFSDDSDGFVSYTNMSISNYDALLTRFVELGLESKYFAAGDLYYCNELIHAQLTNEQGWDFAFDEVGPDCSSLNLITGNVGFDELGAGCNGNEVIFNGGILINIVNDTTDIGLLPNSSGEYSYNVGEGDFEVNLITEEEYYTSNPETTTVNFEGTGNEDQINFCISPSESIEDLNIRLLPIDQARPGFDSEYQLIVENIGTQTVSDISVTLSFDNQKQTFLSAIPNQSSLNGNDLSFTIDELPPFMSENFELNFENATPPALNGGDVLNFTASVTPNENDNTPEDNEFNLDQTVVNSFDPNDKKVLQGDEILEERTDEYLDYMIRFQNTGTANAVNVRLADTLDEKLDWTTLRPVSSSHDFRVEIDAETNSVQFLFDNIDLPQENIDAEGSQGFIAFKIKPMPDVELGDIISNKSYIYFDFNEPIITNTTTTEIVDQLSVKTISNKNPLTVYPNPTKDKIFIDAASGLQLKSIELHDIKGQTLKSFRGKVKQLDLRNLETGVYFIKVKTNRGLLTKRIIKQ